MSKENKREQILSALAELLPGKRFHEITLDEVAKAAKVGKGTIYLYFHDKEDLFAEMLCYQLEQLKQQIAELAPCSLQTLPPKVYELVNKFIHQHNSSFGSIGEMASQIASMSSEQHEQVRQAGKAVLEALAQVMQNSNPQWSEAEAEFNARTLLWLIDGSARSSFSDPGNQVLPEDVINFFCRGAMIK
ncbi:MAG: TetR/AcrR family transcriptional regulator [Lentisphaerae bacterium]|nr:TetR/AcrR family transcriptional regulator [Lentisphaerota bacterium]